MYQLSDALPPLPLPHAASTLMDSVAAATPATTLEIGRTAIPPPTRPGSFGVRDARHGDAPNVTSWPEERNRSRRWQPGAVGTRPEPRRIGFDHVATHPRPDQA